MQELSFLDKIKILFDNILAHPLFTLLFFVPLVIYFLQKKHGRKVFIIVYFLIIFSILIVFGDVIFKLFDNLMDGFFMVLYFPNFITLFGIVLLASAFALITIFSSRMYKINKIINYMSFGIIQMLFVLILITIRVNKINVYKSNALYTNSDVLSLMQLLVGTFVLQMISIFIISVINRIAEKLDNRRDNFSKDEEPNKTKLFKSFKLNNEKVGFINVTQGKSEYKPKLKPFKFDINKLESISLNIVSKPKLYNIITLKDNLYSYLNEITKSKKYRLVNLDSDKLKNINLDHKLEKEKLFSKVFLNSANFSYLNENVKFKNYKLVNLDYNKAQNIKLVLNDNKKLYKKVPISNKVFSYLNEAIKTRKFKPSNIDFSKIRYVKSSGNAKNKSGVSNVKLDLNKSYLIDIKPDLMRPMSFNKKFLSKKVMIIENQMVKNVNIVNVQSCIDSFSKYKLDKARLKGFDNVLTINNLKISDFDLLLKVVECYKLYK